MKKLAAKMGLLLFLLISLMLIFLIPGEFCNEYDANTKNILDFETKDHYYKTVTLTDQNTCHIIKQIAGRWIGQCGFLDGEKYICIDRLYPALRNDTCLVYSFGLADDWDFEIWMASLGCVVRAYDPTSKVKINSEAMKFDNLHYYKIGIGRHDSETSVFLKKEEEIIKIRTLETIIKMNGDENKTLTYLKVDVEGFEIWSLKNWMDSNVLKNVEQLGIEMHTSCNVIKKSKTKEFDNIVLFIRHILSHYRLKLVAYNPNRCYGKLHDTQKIYFSNHDLLFVKEYNVKQ